MRGLDKFKKEIKAEVEKVKDAKKKKYAEEQAKVIIKHIEDVADEVVYLPKCNSLFTSSYGVLPTQLFAYYVAVERGCDVDKHRNLAKSVTVE